MEIVYCDVCGHRIPDANFADGSAVRLDDRNICSRCPKPEVPRVQPATATAHAASRETVAHRPLPATARRTTTTVPKMTPATARMQASSESKALSPGVQPHQPVKSNVGLIIVAAGIVVVLAVVGVVMMTGSPAAMSSKDRDKDRPDASAPHGNESRSSAGPAPAAPAPRPAASAPAGNADPEKDAATVLNNVLKFEGLAKDDYAGKVARLEEFIDKHESSSSATRAQMLVRDLRQQAVDSGGPAVPLTPAAPDPAPATRPEPAPAPATPPQPAPAPAQPVATQAAPADAALPAPPSIKAAAAWKMDLSLQDSIAQGKVQQTADGSVLRSIPAPDDADWKSVIEYEAMKNGLLFTVNENSCLVFSYYATAGSALKVQMWARDGDKFGNVTLELQNLKLNEWTTIAQRMAGSFRTKNGRGDPIKPGIAARNVQFYAGPAAGELFVTNVMITDGPLPDDAIVKRGTAAAPAGGARYETFARSYFEALARGDDDAARELLKKAESDPDVKGSLTVDAKALDWFRDIESALVTGATKIKDAGSTFDLRTRTGDTYRVGKAEQLQVTAIGNGVLTLSSNVKIPLAILDRTSRWALANQGLDWDVQSILRHNFINILRLAATLDDVMIEQIRADIQKRKKDGVPGPECDYQEKLLGIIEKDLPELQAAITFEELQQIKAPLIARRVAIAWQKKCGNTKFAASHADALKELNGGGANGAQQPAAAASLTDGLVGHWKFDENAGAKSAVDASGKGNAGKPGPGCSFGTGVIGGAASFDGGAGFMDIPGVTVTGNAFSVSCWVKHNSIGTKSERYLTFGDETCVLKHDGNGQISFSMKTEKANVLSAKTAVGAQKWTLITATWDGTTQKLYQDGKLLQEQVPGGAIKNATNLKVGGFVIQGFAGMVDDVRIYGRALTPEEVSALAAMVVKK